MSIVASLFEEIPVAPPLTEGIKYAGSKQKLLSQILMLARKTGARSVLDGFGGSTRVSQAFARDGYRVVCNDRAVWTETFATCYLKASNSSGRYADLIAHLNAMPPTEGWYTEHYGGATESREGSAKRPWQIHNTMKLDAIRDEIDRLQLGQIDKAVMLTSLILALDKVESTLGHFASYLREWSPRSYQTLQMKVPSIVPSNEAHEVFREDIFNIAPNSQVDLAYFDPPYGSNNEKMPPSRVRYAAYYHIWTTICSNDRPTLFGKVNRRLDSSDSFDGSVFEEFRKDVKGRFISVEAIRSLLLQTSAPWIILSYSTGGRATAKELNAAIESCGRVKEVIEIDHRENVMASMKWTNQWLRDAVVPNREMLFLIEKR
jgi:adenine-specific DNA-methyltransferase